MEKNLRRLSPWSSLNWSPPNADTQGLIPPVPMAITIRPIAARALQGVVCGEVVCVWGVGCWG